MISFKDTDAEHHNEAQMGRPKGRGLSDDPSESIALQYMNHDEPYRSLQSSQISFIAAPVPNR